MLVGRICPTKKHCTRRCAHGIRSSARGLDSSTGRHHSYLIEKRSSLGKTRRRSQNLQVYVRRALERQSLQPLPEREIRCLVDGRHNSRNVPPNESEILDVLVRPERISVRVCRPEKLRLFDSTFLTKRQVLDESMWIVRLGSGHVPAPGFRISRWNRDW